MMTPAREQLIVALDVPSVDQARALIERLGDSVGVYKIGLELLFAGGLALGEELAAAGTACSSMRSCSTSRRRSSARRLSIARTGAAFLTVHALDRKTLDAAVRGRGDSRLKLLGVTVLTNLAAGRSRRSRASTSAAGELVLHRAMLAKEAGFDGVVASGPRGGGDPRDAAGSGFLIVTPGIRPKGVPTQDQARVVTPATAIAAGADYLVVGRPITARPTRAPRPKPSWRRSMSALVG